jgi:NAD(P)-dependent dehydrogenase (short-subunit alcohol dehydrogenase family)
VGRPRPGGPSAPLFGGTVPVPAVEVPGGATPLVVVTGPGGPLGQAVRTAFGRHGCLVAGVGGGPAASRPTGPALPPVLELEGDLASAEQVDRAAEFVSRVGEPVVGMVHVVVPSVGPVVSAVPGDEVLDRLDDDYLRGLRGPYQLTRRLLPSLTTHGGRVVVVHPESGPAGAPALPDSMRVELDSHGISVCSLAVESHPGADVAGGLDALADLVVATVLGRGAVELTSVRARLR